MSKRTCSGTATHTLQASSCTFGQSGSPTHPQASRKALHRGKLRRHHALLCVLCNTPPCLYIHCTRQHGSAASYQPNQSPGILNLRPWDQPQTLVVDGVGKALPAEQVQCPAGQQGTRQAPTNKGNPLGWPVLMRWSCLGMCAGSEFPTTTPHTTVGRSTGQPH